MRRAKVSTPPPGDTGTTMRIGRLGKTACARTIPGASAAPAVARSDEIASRRFVEMILTGCPPTKGIAQIDTAALRDFDPAIRCPLCPRKRTSTPHHGMSHECHYRL